jgi:hypothetical protein
MILSRLFPSTQIVGVELEQKLLDLARARLSLSDRKCRVFALPFRRRTTRQSRSIRSYIAQRRL